MSKTHRCTECPHNVEHWTDEICAACGRCIVHCYPIDLAFSPKARLQDDRPHPDAGKRVRVGFAPARPDLDNPDNAELPL